MLATPSIPLKGHLVKFLSGEKKDKEVSNVPMSCVIVVRKFYQ